MLCFGVTLLDAAAFMPNGAEPVASRGASGALARFALLGLMVGLIGLGALMLWATLRWLRRRSEARRAAPERRGGHQPAAVGAWAEAGRRLAGDQVPTPWPSIPNPNLRDPIERRIEADDEDEELDETSPLCGDAALDDTEDANAGDDDRVDTGIDDHWEFEGDGDDDAQHEEPGTRFGDDSIGFDDDGTDDPDADDGDEDGPTGRRG